MALPTPDDDIQDGRLPDGSVPFGVDPNQYEQAVQEEQKKGTGFPGIRDFQKAAKNNKAVTAGKAGVDVAKNAKNVATGAKTAAALGQAATGVGIAGAIVTATSAAKDLLVSAKEVWHGRNPWRNQLLIVSAILLSIILIASVMFYVFFSTLLNINLSHDGATQTRPANDPNFPSIGAKQPGLVVASTPAKVDAMIKTISDILKSPPGGANVIEAQRIFKEMQSLQAELKTKAYASDTKLPAETATKFHDLTTDLNIALYPGRSAPQSRVLAAASAGKIKYNRVGSCNPKRDIEESRLTETAYTVIAEAATVDNIAINCLIIGHRKYVGRDPRKGNPYCGDAATLQASLSLHCLGKAIDLAPNAKVEKYLNENKERLNLKLVLDEDNHLHIEVN